MLPYILYFHVTIVFFLLYCNFLSLLSLSVSLSFSFKLFIPSLLIIKPYTQLFSYRFFQIFSLTLASVSASIDFNSSFSNNLPWLVDH